MVRKSLDFYGVLPLRYVEVFFLMFHLVLSRLRPKEEFCCLKKSKNYHNLKAFILFI